MERLFNAENSEIISAKPVFIEDLLERKLKVLKHFDFKDCDIHINSSTASNGTNYTAILDAPIVAKNLYDFLKFVSPNSSMVVHPRAIISDWKIFEDDSNFNDRLKSQHSQALGGSWQEFADAYKYFMESLRGREFDEQLIKKIGIPKTDEQLGQSASVFIPDELLKQLIIANEEQKKGIETIIESDEGDVRFRTIGHEKFAISVDRRLSINAYIDEDCSSVLLDPLWTRETTNFMYPTIRWNVSSDGKRIVFSTPLTDDELGKINRPRLESEPFLRGELVLGTNCYSTILGLLSVVYFNPEIKDAWPIESSFNERDENKKYIGASQVPVLALLHREDLLKSDFFEKAEKYIRDNKLN